MVKCVLREALAVGHSGKMTCPSCFRSGQFTLGRLPSRGPIDSSPWASTVLAAKSDPSTPRVFKKRSVVCHLSPSSNSHSLGALALLENSGLWSQNSVTDESVL